MILERNPKKPISRLRFFGVVNFGMYLLSFKRINFKKANHNIQDFITKRTIILIDFVTKLELCLHLFT